MTQWRDLLEHLGVEWTDSSRYAGHGWIGIRCPWCADDPGFHLGINEQGGHYRCLRNENHRGRSATYLLRGLGISQAEITGLLRAYGVSGSALRDPPLLRSSSPLAARWRQFTPAADNLPALTYLFERGFPDPARTAREFDLRVGTGQFARRLWFRLTDLRGNVVGFTGRAMDKRQPRYFTQCAEPVLYLPRRVDPRHRLALLVEGPIDAVRVAEATRRRYNMVTAALCGLSATGARRQQLSELAKTVPSFVVALDSSVWASESNRLIDELRAISVIGKVRRLALPSGFDDPGEMSTSDVEAWLSTIAREGPGGGTAMARSV